MTLQQALKEVYLTYTAFRGSGNSADYEAVYEIYNKEFGGGNQLINACLMAFELKMDNEASTTLRKALSSLNDQEPYKNN